MEPIIFIAPFQELAQAAQHVIREAQLKIPILIASNENALKAAEAYPSASVIISRGGTANDLKALREKTIVEINTSFSDIFTVIEKMLLKQCKKIGVVTRDNIIDNVTRDFDFLGTKILIRPCKTDAQIEMLVHQLYKEGIDGIIGCNKAVHAAEKLKIANAYIESSEISIRKAVNEAMNIIRSKEMERLQLERMNAVINNIQEGILILTRDHQPIFYNNAAENIFGPAPQSTWYNKIAHHLSELRQEKIITIGAHKLLIKSIPLKIYNNKSDVLVFQEAANIEKSERKVRLSAYEKGLYAKLNFSDIISHTANMKTVLALAEKFSHAESNILIYGETGTGKEGLAQSIHNAGPRRNNPFVSVNCASLPPNLIESELFGYVDGAFTGARKSGKRGLFELAHSGTIFLDEIGELPLDVQSRLLRVLQEREIMRIGDDKILPLDIRVICATNKDLKKLVWKGLFREDLYYRINVLKLKLPPLRERHEDILPLIKFYLRHFTQTDCHLSEAAKQALQNYSWPGNIRELKNIAEILAFDSSATIEADKVRAAFDEDDDITPVLTDDFIRLPYNLTLKEAEKEIINQYLQKEKPETVCSKLGISRITLWRKLKK